MKQLIVALALFCMFAMSQGALQASDATHPNMSKSAEFGFFCEQIWPNGGGYCGVSIQGSTPPPTVYIWSQTGEATLPSPCGPNAILCNYGCAGTGTGFGTINVSVYDGNGTLIGSGSRGVC